MHIGVMTNTYCNTRKLQHILRHTLQQTLQHTLQHTLQQDTFQDSDTLPAAQLHWYICEWWLIHIARVKDRRRYATHVVTFDCVYVYTDWCRREASCEKTLISKYIYTHTCTCLNNNIRESITWRVCVYIFRERSWCSPWGKALRIICMCALIHLETILWLN